MLTRAQALVIGLFAAIAVIVVVIGFAAPDVLTRATGLAPSAMGAGLAALAVLIAFIVVGTLRRWRWLFWVLMLVLLAGGLRIPVVALQLSGVLPTGLPAWYVLVQGALGAAQLGIGLVLVADHRRAGVWGRRAPGAPPGADVP